MAILDQFATIF